MTVVLTMLLALAAMFALIGYAFTAFNNLSDRSLMPQLLIAFILAIGFLSLMARP